MSAAAPAHHFSPPHPMTDIFFRLDVLLGERFVKARPARTGLELRIRIEKLISARRTQIHSGVFRLVILPGEWRLRPFHPADLILLGCELLLPFLFGLLDFF